MHFKNEDLFNLFQKAKTKCLVGEGKATHTRLDAEDVVVGREHVEVRAVSRGRSGDGNLRVVDTGEVAGAGGLVFLGLKGERIRVNTGEGAAGVVVEGLHLVEILTTLRLEAVLAVENKLELRHRTLVFLSPGFTGRHRSGAITTGDNERSTGSGGDGEGLHGGGSGRRGAGSERNLGRTAALTEVPEGINLITSEAPHELLDGVVVREANLLSAAGINGVNTSVLNLLDQVLMTLLREAATLLSVKVDVVSPHLEGADVEVGRHGGREVEIDADLVILESNQGQIEPGIPVKKEEERKEDSLARIRSGELTVSGLLGLIEVELSVETPPLLVLLVYTLTTDGQLDRRDRTLSSPLGGTTGGGGLKLDIHVTDEITVAGDSHGNAAGVAGVTVESLLDVLHREVGVTLVLRLVKSYLGVTSKVDILGTVSYELHKTTGHFESFCTICGENNSATFRDQIFLCLDKMSVHPEDLEEGEIVPEDEIEDEIDDDDDDELMEIDEDEDEDEDEELDVVTLMTSLLATEDGDTVCTALITIAQQLQTQNKILIKMLSKM